MENIYTPPLTRTVHPPIEHRRTAPNYEKHTDADRKGFFTNFNKELLEVIRSQRHNLVTCKPANES